MSCLHTVDVYAYVLPAHCVCAKIGNPIIELFGLFVFGVDSTFFRPGAMAQEPKQRGVARPTHVLHTQPGGHVHGGVPAGVGGPAPLQHHARPVRWARCDCAHCVLWTVVLRDPLLHHFTNAMFLSSSLMYFCMCR